jgi:MFS family permease
MRSRSPAAHVLNRVSRRPDPLLLLLCLMLGVQTCSIGAFPALLPEIGRTAALADWQLGAVAGAFGFARMFADVPAGLLMTHHARRALVAAPIFLLVGVGVLTGAGGSFAGLLAGRALMGAGHTLGTLAGLTTILRMWPGRGVALNSFEFSAMVGVLSGAGLVALLPRTLSWNAALLIATVPVACGLLALPRILTALPSSATARPWFARSAAAGDASAEQRGDRAGVVVAFAAGGAIALTYASVDLYLLPVRASREFGLDRGGIARLLMLAQACDLAALLPLGALADRWGAGRLLGTLLVMFASAIAFIGLGGLPLLAVGAVLFGVAMGGWLLPVALLRAATPASQIAWRTALYRVCVDGAMFLGPVASGVIAGAHPGLVPVTLAVVLLAVSVAVFARTVATAEPSPSARR